jgi:protein-S-isoprenylcysteine O-methyltransferase Ste14
MNSKTLGSLLVTLQFLSLGVLILLTFQRQPLVPLSWLALGCSGAVGLWALVSNRPGNFNIRPTPHINGVLIQTGPYHWIRHPMYTAVMLLGSACGMTLSSGLGWLLWTILAFVLLSKALLEERWMTALHPTYTQYKTRTKRFLPYIF